MTQPVLLLDGGLGQELIRRSTAAGTSSLVTTSDVE
jgi:S-methylmethionine-dependent homocysteine/selenocysteine methylase